MFWNKPDFKKTIAELSDELAAMHAQLGKLKADISGIEAELLIIKEKSLDKRRTAIKKTEESENLYSDGLPRIKV